MTFEGRRDSFFENGPVGTIVSEANDLKPDGTDVLALRALLEVCRPCGDFGVDRLSALALDPLMGFQNRVLAVDIIGRGGRARRAVGVGDDFDHRGLISTRQGGGAGPGRGSSSNDDACLSQLGRGPPLRLAGYVRQSQALFFVLLACDRRSPQHAIGRHGAGQGRHGGDSGMLLRDLYGARGGGPDMAGPCVEQSAAALLALSPDGFLLLPDARKFRDEKGANIRLHYAELLVGKRLQAGASPQARAIGDDHRLDGGVHLRERQIDRAKQFFAVGELRRVAEIYALHDLRDVPPDRPQLLADGRELLPVLQR